ncbi:MAG: NAD(P)H-binding protein [Burkholderiales bacterium]
MTILVLGGAGFIGRHVVAALLARRESVAIGTRNPRRALRRLPAAASCGLREAHLERLTSPASWYGLLEGIDVVVNAVGILRERGAETYEGVHHLAPHALSEICARLGLRLIHVSALGLHDGARSGFLTSKLAGERAIAGSGADYTIVRPSLLDGDGGFGARWLRWAAGWPVRLVPAGAAGRIAALDVSDLGNAIATLCVPHARGVWREVELGGSESWTIAEYLAVLGTRGRSPAPIVEVPAWLARIGSYVCDLLHFSPFSSGHLELMRRDNVPRENLLPVLLGRAPTPVGLRLSRQAFASTPTGQETPVPPSPQ